MKPIQKDELYEHLSSFLKGKGVELKEGPYTKGIHAGCSLLADAINLSQAGIQKARTEIGKQLDEVRQVIHEKTAPKPAKPPRPANAKTNAGGNAFAGKGTSRANAKANRKPKPGATPSKRRPKR